MNLSQGLYRLAQIIKWSGRVLGGFWFVGVSVSFLNSERTQVLKVDTIFFLCLAIALVVVTEGIAWVLEGFADD
jgi:hypothetical protein